MFYKPENGWTADFIPFYHDGTFYLFYLHDYRSPETHGEGTPWYLVTTKDLVHFTEHGEVLPRGGVEDQDLYVFTGSVFEGEDRFHIFYTGHNPHLRAAGKPEQAVMHAVSDDLIHWRKCPEDTFFAPGELGFEPHDWRDPFVFSHEGGYHMLLAARYTDGPKVRRGLTAHLVSSDLKHWELTEPMWYPELYFAHECPDWFRMGGHYYLIYSEFSDRSLTRYVVSDGPFGPWRAPEQDCFDTRAFYAAKTASNGKERYLFGWNPTKEGNADDGRFQWGGNLVVHQLVPRPDGSLAVREPSQRKEAFQSMTEPVLVPESGTFEGGLLSRPEGFASVLAEAPVKENFRLTATLIPRGTTRFGVRFRYSPEEDASHALLFEAGKSTVYYARYPNPLWGSVDGGGCLRPLKIKEGEPIRLTLNVSGAVVSAYFNDDMAFSARAYQVFGDRLSFFTVHGGLEIRDLKLWTE